MPGCRRWRNAADVVAAVAAVAAEAGNTPAIAIIATAAVDKILFIYYFVCVGYCVGYYADCVVTLEPL